jgi:hypothetical protein
MNEILLIIGSACVGFSFAEVSMIPQMFAVWLCDEFDIGRKIPGYDYVRRPYRLKPFDCGYCLSFWVAFLSALYFNYGIVASLIIAFTSSVASILIKKLV